MNLSTRRTSTLQSDIETLRGQLWNCGSGKRRRAIEYRIADIQAEIASRAGGKVSRRAHNPDKAGSTPAPATLSLMAYPELASPWVRRAA